jgi:hypothetical protein
MDRFYPDIESLDAFTRSLAGLGEKIQCNHCLQYGQMVSHGFIYNQHASAEKAPVGKRVFCSNRYGRSGCGRTHQLYLAHRFPYLRYGAAQLLIFLTSLLMGRHLEDAYEAATGQVEPRNAWRWLKRLRLNLTDFRCFLKARRRPMEAAVQLKNRRLSLLLSTLKALLSLLPHCPCSQYQIQQQRAFI